MDIVRKNKKRDTESVCVPIRTSAVTAYNVIHLQDLAPVLYEVNKPQQNVNTLLSLHKLSQDEQKCGDHIKIMSGCSKT